MFYAFNNRIRRLRQTELIVFYLVVTALYVALPEPLGALRRLLSPFLAGLLVLIVYRALVGSSDQN